MIFNKHSDLEGQHAFLSPSKYHWINYDPAKLTRVYLKHLATVKGTQLHEFACLCIKLKVNLPDTKDALNQYVNDAIKFHMIPEQPIKYSNNAFGHADTIMFENDFLRIHDFKSGEAPTSFNQLKIYAAFFCLEYDVDPYKIVIELRIYQGKEVKIYRPSAEEIEKIMVTVVDFDNLIEEIKEGGGIDELS